MINIKRKLNVHFSRRDRDTYYDVNTMPNGDLWMTITTKVDDPVFFTRLYLTTFDFKKLPGAVGWSPTPCSAR